MSAPENLKPCADVAPLLVFYVCDEVDAGERAQIEAHLATCADCAAQLAEERSFQEALDATPQAADLIDSTGLLLSQCRSELAEKLDDLSRPPVREHWQPFGWVRRWMALRPAWSAALLVVFGVVVGTQLAPWYAAPSGDTGGGQAVNVLAAPRLSDDQLSKMAIGGINLVPAPDAAPGTFQVQLRAEQPLVLSGDVDDLDMRRVLTYVIANGKQFDPGIRLDCLEALKARSGEKEVRQALLIAARRDQNPAVRMKALESLRDAAGDNNVREALLEALQQEENPGVRVEAVNLLVRSLDQNVLRAPEAPEVPPVPEDPSIERVVRTLQELQRHDPNRYVRLRSAAALRQIGPRELH